MHRFARFCGRNCKTKNSSSANQIIHHRSRVATDSTSWDYQACTRDTLWRQHYVTTSKEYLINCHILLQYFELVSLQLQLIKMLCRLIIIWMNYEKNKKGSLFMKHRVHAFHTPWRHKCSVLMSFKLKVRVERRDWTVWTELTWFCFWWTDQ